VVSGIKGLVKRGVKGTLRRAGNVLPPRLPGSRILTYHSVGARDHEMNVRLEAFREQMAWLADTQKVITLAEAEQGVEGIAITFDDGYRDNLTNAAPVLNQHGFPATVFMVAGKAGGMLPHDSDPSTANLMTWDEVRALHSRGMEIGAHSMTHPRLSQLDPTEQREEIVGSVKRISDELQRPVRSFAYPYGTAKDYNATTIQLVQVAGCLRAVSNRYGTNTTAADKWQLQRIWIDISDDLESFQAKVDGRLDGLALLETRPALGARRMLNRLTERP
jgi:peptidoglycan/xylan/chitin deacetylase (PgdA/CDA1 family)